MNQRIAYIDRMVSIQEKKIIQFFIIYVEKLIEFAENPFDNVNTENYEKVNKTKYSLNNSIQILISLIFLNLIT